ncbi:hypothetical protein N566_16635 [Streptomycetaceae bacterium MP113-05]|nr:hypothetical protein N566_16635 [Streptomycetaceae bacterium MP113-05]
MKAPINESPNAIELNSLPSRTRMPSPSSHVTSATSRHATVVVTSRFVTDTCVVV